MARSSRLGMLALAVAQFAAKASAMLDNMSIRLYFGNGCFFAHQYLLVEGFERNILGRRDDQLTAVQGYGGSAKTGKHGSACYHNAANYSDYGILGHAEVVEVVVPLDYLEQAFNVYFGSFMQFDEGQWSRPDFYDQGSEYRSVLGVPGGMENKRVLEAVKAADTKNITLRPGLGSDPDTFGGNSLYIMDSNKFPFIQAELCLQFHDDSQATYPAAYHKLRDSFVKRGRLANTSCPANYICGGGESAGVVVV
mmetsp:Transcript_23679/g.67427  ORF Transcript_23679/g.67427 Transcript_23679/m.67427 type:complete len:252 (+) Transcript_23679:85-840(+)